MDKLVKIPKKYLILGLGGCVVILLVVGVIWFLNNPNPTNEELSSWELTSSNSQQSVSSSKETNQQVYVDVKGAVKIPGMYQAAATMRVWDVIALAGGVTDEADTKTVNYSQKVTDQMIIYVPKAGEVSVEKIEPATEQSSDSSKKVNLNTATEAELQTVSGIGAKKAQEIVRYREENGPFKTVDDLKNVSGIGEKTVERLKDSLSVD
jgi:competence protein ComEA